MQKQLKSPARRHFLALSGAMAGRAAAATALAVATLSSSSKPANAGIIDRILELLGRHGHGGGGGGGQNCFVKGTRIRTPDGLVCIEDLRIGDLVTSMHNGPVPIKWLGRNTYKVSELAGYNKGATPIRVSRFSLDASTPHSDLYLSPGHALFLDGRLIPVRYLENGASIRQEVPAGVEEVEYIQIVLDTHEMIWAEGVAAETFVANHKSAYQMFANFEEYERLYPADSYRITPLAAEINVGGRAHLQALLCIGLANYIELPNPLAEADAAYERIARRAEELEFV